MAHITRDSDTTFKVKKVKGQLVSDVLNSQHAGRGATWRQNTTILSTCRGGGISWRPPACSLLCRLLYCPVVTTLRLTKLNKLSLTITYLLTYLLTISPRCRRASRPGTSLSEQQTTVSRHILLFSNKDTVNTILFCCLRLMNLLFEAKWPFSACVVVVVVTFNILHLSRTVFPTQWHDRLSHPCVFNAQMSHLSQVSKHSSPGYTPHFDGKLSTI